MPWYYYISIAKKYYCLLLRYDVFFANAGEEIVIVTEMAIVGIAPAPSPLLRVVTVTMDLDLVHGLNRRGKCYKFTFLLLIVLLVYLDPVNTQLVLWFDIFDEMHFPSLVIISTFLHVGKLTLQRAFFNCYMYMFICCFKIQTCISDALYCWCYSFWARYIHFKIMVVLLVLLYVLSVSCTVLFCCLSTC